MLNFENARKVTDKMLESTRIYTENFWQKVFDQLKFREQYSASESIAFPDDFEIEPSDPQEVFAMLTFNVLYCCNGRIEVSFDPHISTESLGFRLSAECLLNNHFTRHQQDERRFVLENVNNF